MNLEKFKKACMSDEYTVMVHHANGHQALEEVYFLDFHERLILGAVSGRYSLISYQAIDLIPKNRSKGFGSGSMGQPHP